MVDLTGSLLAMRDALDAREISARELLDAHLDRIDQLDGTTNAVVTIAAERARAEAGAADDARANDGAVGALAGIPVTIKDAIATEGIVSTGGATELENHVPDDDATVVETIRGEGAVVFAKTNVPRWSGDYQSYNEMFGTTNNPWDAERTPGGSSGGPAAAVAMGFTPFEIGTDIGGSIRLPASFCGIFGHKPSFGIIPTHGYLDSVRYHRSVADVNVFGPLARTIDDLEFVFEMLVAPNPDDAPGWRVELPPPRATELGDFRVAAWIDDPFSPVDPAVLGVMTAAVARLEAAGARIDHDARPELDAAHASILGATLIGAATEISDDDTIERDGDGAGNSTAGMSHRIWDVMHRQRGEFRQRWSEFFDRVDVLLCPVTVVPPFRHVHDPAGSNWANSVLADHDDLPYRDLLRWNTLTGSAYLPVTVPPVGRTADGLPVGIQIVAPYLHDHTALQFARLASEVWGGYQVPPVAQPAST